MMEQINLLMLLQYLILAQSDMPTIYESTSAPTPDDGEDGDIWIQYT